MIHVDIENDTNLRDALKAYEPELNIETSDFNLQHFSYRNRGILNLIFGHLERTNYSGLTVSTVYVPVVKHTIYADYSHMHAG